MLISKALFNILSNDTTITSVVGTRIRPQLNQQTDTYPLIVYTGEDAKPLVTMSGTSGTFNQIITVAAVARDAATSDQLALAIFKSLINRTGTFAGIKVMSFFYSGERETNEPLQNENQDAVLYIKEIDFLVWYRLP